MPDTEADDRAGPGAGNSLNSLVQSVLPLRPLPLPPPHGEAVREKSFLKPLDKHPGVPGISPLCSSPAGTTGLILGEPLMQATANCLPSLAIPALLQHLAHSNSVNVHSQTELDVHPSTTAHRLGSLGCII